MSANAPTAAPRVPGRLPTGVMPEFTRDSLAFVLKVARRYGDVARALFLYIDAYFVSHPDLIERVLVAENRNFIKPRSFRTPFFARIVGQGLLTSEGDFWRRQRRLAQPAFHRDRIRAYADEMSDSAERLTEGWRDRETRDLHEDMQRLTMGIVTRTLFSAEITDTDAEAIREALAEIARPFSRQATLKWIADNRLPTRAHRRFFRQVARLDEVVYRIIAARRESGEDRGDLLSMLLAARDEDGGRMSDLQPRDEVMTLFLAGQETTALALTWAWHLLAENPEAERALHAELDEVLEGGRAARFDHLPRLCRAEAVVKESMRLYPPAWGVGREAARECEVGGYRIPRGAQVFMMAYAVHRDPRFFRDPESFRPQRRTNGETHDLPKFAYFPFGGGPRLCIGNSFAMTETVITLSTLARRFRHAPGRAPVWKFELSYELEGFPGEKYLIPDLLSKEEPYTGEWGGALAFQYHYNVLPGSIISRFIVRMHSHIHRKTSWRTGVVLEHGGNKAFVKADIEDRKIFIRLDGPAPTRRGFLAVIRNHFDSIHKTIPGIVADEKVPLPRRPEIVVDYKHLLNLEVMGEESLIPEGLTERVNVKRLLDGLETEQSRRERQEGRRDRLPPPPTPAERDDGDAGRESAVKMEAERELLTRMKTSLDSTSERQAKRRLWFGFLVLLALWVGLGFLIYKSKWDAIEPWTYFVGLGVVTFVAYGYFAFTQKELSLGGIYQHMVESKKRQNYLASGFDLEKYERLTRPRR